MTAIANWTDVTNSFELGTASPYATLAASSNYAQGGPFASSEIKQEVAIADPYGVALVTFARANVLASDTGTVTIEALNSIGTVLTSTTTGAVAYATLDVWTRVRLALELPLGAVTLRIRLIATRTLGSGNSGAAFDDFSLRVFKHLDAQDVLDLDFSALPVQPLPTTWQKFHLAWPDLAFPSVLLAAGVLSISSTRSFTGQSIAWSDAIAHDVGTCVGAFGAGVASSPSFVFTRAAAGSAVDLQISGGSTERGAFTAAAGFTVRVVGRIDEPGLSTACGVIGRGTSALGWGMTINASGNVVATLRGASGTKTATSSTTIHDGAIHQLVMVYSATANTLRIYVDRRGYNETSTSSGLGAFTVTTAPVRIGRDLATSETMPGQIVEVELFESALTEAEIESMWTLGADPTGEIDTYTRAVAAWVDQEANANGVTLACLASDQVAIGRHAASSTTGLATCQAMTNLVASFDFAAASWAKDAGTTKTTGVVDCTGLARGTTLVVDASNGFRHTGMTVSAVAKIGVTFYARALSGTPTLNLRLKSSAGVVKDTVAVVLSTLWARYDVMFDTWDAATATCHVEWIGASGAVTFSLAHVVGVYQAAALAEAQHPTLIPAAAGGTFASGVYASCTRTMPTQWSAEGEIDVAGVAVTATPPVLAAVVEVGKAATVDNRRIVRVDDNSASPELLLYDGLAALVSSSEATAIDWTTAWRLRGRWNRSKMLDNAANAYGGIVVTGSAASAVYAQNAAWTDDTAMIANTVLIGADTPDAVRLSAYVSRVTLRAGPKLLP